MAESEQILTAFKDALGTVLQENLVRDTLKYEADFLTIEGKRDRLDDCRGVHLFGSGKASVETARAVKAVPGDRVTGGLVVSSDAAGIDGIGVFESSHPVLAEKSSRETLMEKVAGLSPDDFFIYLLSGGMGSIIRPG